MKNSIGVMQGRLLPKYQGRYQAHPLGYWQDEFKVASEIGLDCIEFILDYNEAELNPLLKEGGIDEIQSEIEKNKVDVKSICADYFMEAPLHSPDSKISEDSLQILKRLINSASELNIKDIVIPCVDQSTLDSNESVERFVKVICHVLPIIEDKKINLSLETDLSPIPFAELLDKFSSEHVTVNYDIGNSASLGFDPVDELNAYGDKITDIHIKDRTMGGGPVTLGEGDADFVRFFNKLKDYNYIGPFIMQAYRDDEGVEIFKKQLSWIKPYIEELK